MQLTACGKPYSHEPHGYITPTGAIDICDGYLRKLA